MSGTNLFRRSTTAPSADNKAVAELVDHRLTIQRAPWNMQVELIANAVGLQPGNTLITDNAAPIAGSLASRLGHQRIQDFVTGTNVSNSLGMQWELFIDQVKAYLACKTFDLLPTSVAEVLGDVGRVERLLNRPADSAAEFHNILRSQLVFEHQSERSLFERKTSSLAAERDQAVERAAHLEAENTTLQARITQVTQHQERLIESLRTESTESKSALSDVRSQLAETQSALTRAHLRIEQLTAELTHVLGTDIESYQSMVAANANLESALAAVKAEKRDLENRVKELQKIEKRLISVCERRDKLMAEAALTIKSKKRIIQRQNKLVGTLTTQRTQALICAGIAIVAAISVIAFGI